MINDPLLILAGIVLLGIACQLLAWFVRLPAILFLLISGIVVGPLLGVLEPDQLFGQLLFPMVSLSVAVILFEGSLTLRMQEIRGLGAVVRNLITLGALVTWIITALAAHHFMGFDLDLAMLFGAITVVTGPTVIVPMLRTVRPNAKIANVLKWEGIVIDPLGALLAVLVFDFIISTKSGLGESHISAVFGRMVLSGLLVGAGAAWMLGLVLRRHVVPEYLVNVLSLSVVFAAYAASNAVAEESGLLAVTVMGMMLANMKDTDVEDILDFKESLSVLLISVLFIILAARIEFDQLLRAGWPSLLVLATVMLLARPLAVFISTLGSDLNLRERLLIAWIGPRGIVCAAVAAIFSLKLTEAGIEQAQLLVPLAFLIIIGTVVIQSATAKPLARLLGVREPPPTGFLIVGAGIVGRTLGKALSKQDVKVLLTDTNWENTSAARMDGLNVYYGNPISEHADTHLDRVGIGRVLAVSGRGSLDTLACLHLTSDFGSGNVYELQTTRDQLQSEKHRVSHRSRGRPLFGKEVTHGGFANWLRAGAEVKITQLSEEFDFASFRERYGEHVVPLFAVDPKGRIQVFSADDELNPGNEWKVISLIHPDASGATAAGTPPAAGAELTREAGTPP